MCGQYGSESWTISRAMQERLQAVEMWFLRRMLRIPWVDRVTNEEVLGRAGTHIQLMRTIGRFVFFRPYIKATRSWQSPLRMLTSGLCWYPWLILHNAECAKCGFSGQANNHGVQCSIHRISSMVYGRPNYITHEPVFEPGSCLTH